MRDKRAEPISERRVKEREARGDPVDEEPSDSQARSALRRELDLNLEIEAPGVEIERGAEDDPRRRGALVVVVVVDPPLLDGEAAGLTKREALVGGPYADWTASGMTPKKV